ncbi:MAG: Glu-tRNA(Gln) amidotransferase subunit GatE [Candidatus Woesearchaeota archaeon]
MNIDYQKLGFKCGIEIHQQLETNKLFCSCPSIVRDENPDIYFTRKLRAVVGETGEIDAAALHEQNKQKTYNYQACSSSCCEVEFDEEPPHPVNEHALHTVLMVAKLLNAKITDELHFMRKTVVDGSNVGGFQRTGLVATDGYLETSKGKVGITVILLEEEAAKKIKEDENSTTYRLDRLGIPLIEIGTDASIKDPEHAKEVASILGMMLRSTERVKRGLGTIRQDVNVSIKGGARTEVKGFQDLKSIPKVIENEVKRQIKEIKAGKKIDTEVRKAEPDFTTSFMRPMPGAARMYPETDIPVIPITKKLLDQIELPELFSEKALKLEKTYKLNADISNEIVKSGIDLDIYAKKYPKVEPLTIARTLIEIPKEIKSRLNLDISKLTDNDYNEVLDLLNKNQISKGNILDILEKKIKGEKINLKQFEKADESEVESEIKKIIKEKPDLSVGAYMGLLMKKYHGKVDGKVLNSLLNKHLK